MDSHTLEVLHKLHSQLAELDETGEDDSVSAAMTIVYDQIVLEELRDKISRDAVHNTEELNKTEL